MNGERPAAVAAECNKLPIARPVILVANYG